jgi:hypothetical protein
VSHNSPSRGRMGRLPLIGTFGGRRGMQPNPRCPLPESRAHRACRPLIHGGTDVTPPSRSWICRGAVSRLRHRDVCAHPDPDLLPAFFRETDGPENPLNAAGRVDFGSGWCFARICLGSVHASFRLTIVEGPKALRGSHGSRKEGGPPPQAGRKTKREGLVNEQPDTLVFPNLGKRALQRGSLGIAMPLVRGRVG